MIDPSSRDPAGRARKVWVTWLLLAAAFSIFPVFLILGTRSASGLFLGLSVLRLGMAAIFLAAALLLLALAVDDRLRPEASAARRERLLALLNRRPVWSIMAVLSALLALGAAAFLTLLPDLEAEAAIVAERLLPMVIWVGSLGALTLAALTMLRHSRPAADLLPHGRLFYAILLIFALLFMVWGWVARVIIPNEAQRLGWNHLGSALIGSQVLLVWLASTALAALIGQTSASKTAGAAGRPSASRSRRVWIDFGFSVLVWLTAVLVWRAAPIVPNWFLSEPVYPNFEFYPNSDARAYDVSAQTALIGEGYTFYDQPYIRRSLLAFYLTGLHLLAGQDYERVIGLQILVLALIPVGLYWIARRLHNRHAGLMLAGLVILREGNAIRLAGDITTSNARLIMADLPATLLSIAVFLMALRWLTALNTPGADEAAASRARKAALLCGGMLGFSMLVRLETFTFFLALALAGGLVLWARHDRPSRARFRLWLQSGLLALLGILMVISPWVYRNYSITGKVFIDHPYFQIGLLLQRFHPDLETLRPQRQTPAAPQKTPRPSTQTPHEAAVVQPTLPAQPQPTAAVNRAPIPTPTPPSTYPEEFLESEANKAVEFIGSNLGDLSRLALAHILNSQVQTFLILPSAPLGVESAINAISHRSVAKALDECCTPQSAVRKLPYWHEWDGRFPARSIIPLTLTLLAIAYGLNSTWKRSGWVGLAPMIIAVTYITFNGVLRNSGGRYILPVDWTVLLYFSIGLAQSTQNLAGYLIGKPAAELLEDGYASSATGVQQTETAAVSERPRLSSGARLALTALGLLLLGSLVPLAEVAFPKRYSAETSDAMYLSFMESEQLTTQQRQNIQDYLRGGAIALTGRGLYPRFFPRDVGDDVARRSPFAPRPYPRMGFYLIGDFNQTMALPVEDKPPKFPNGADVLAIVCPEREILALALFHPDGSLNKVYLRSPFPEPPYRCPLPEEPAAAND